MGYYIQGPAIGKAEHLISKYGAREVSDTQNLLKAQVALREEAVVCVVLNGVLDAAAFIHSDNELEAFLDRADKRPKRWLVMNMDTAKRLSNYNK